MNLFFREMGKGQPLIILHGLFGASDNWISIGKVLSEQFKVYLVDQRNHGQSPHADEFSYPAMAEDLREFIEQHEIDNPIILGHSMGGKTAMQFALENQDAFDKLIVVDIGPKAYPVHHRTILDGLLSINLSTLASRGEADKQLAEYIPELGVRQFLLKNLGRGSSGFKWKINLPVINERIEIIGHGTEGKLLTDKEVLFIRGENSNYILDEDIALINETFPTARLETVENAGHWVHAEKPQVVIDIVSAFTNS
ncbi:MAG: alpha/beta fold hydrolase [Bacteroidota bacterium]